MQQLGERSEKMRETALLIPRSGEGRSSLWWRLCWIRFSLVAHGGAWASRDLPCSLSQCQSRQMYLEGGCSLYRACATAGGCQELWPVGKLHGNSSWRTLHRKNNTCWSNSWRTASVGGTPYWNWGGGFGGRNSKGEMLQVNVKRPQLLLPVPLPCLWGGGGRRIWSELEPGKKD